MCVYIDIGFLFRLCKTKINAEYGAVHILFLVALLLLIKDLRQNGPAGLFLVSYFCVFFCDFVIIL